MSSDFFVWCFIVVNFEEIRTRHYRDVMIWRTKYNKKWSISTFRETYINWNWLDQAWGRFRDALYEMNVVVRDVKYRRIKDVIKVGFKSVGLLIWTKYAGVLLSFDDRKCFWFCIYYKVFLNICANILGCVWPFESWCVEFVYIPGCVWNFYVWLSKMNCEGSSYCQILDWLKFDDDVLPLSFSMALMLQRCVVFAEDDDAN